MGVRTLPNFKVGVFSPNPPSKSRAPSGTYSLSLSNENEEIKEEDEKEKVLECFQLPINRSLSL